MRYLSCAPGVIVDVQPLGVAGVCEFVPSGIDVGLKSTGLLDVLERWLGALAKTGHVNWNPLCPRVLSGLGMTGNDALRGTINLRLR